MTQSGVAMATVQTQPELWTLLVLMDNTPLQYG